MYRSKWTRPSLLTLLFLGILIVAPAPAQETESPEPTDPNITLDPEFFEGLEYRHTGFTRGGRSTAVTGVPGDRLTYYVGYTGGGVWRTTDAGTTWNNISDGFFNVASIGDIKVAPSDPNVIYVGTGSGCPRGNISVGDGIYKSTDAGDTWEHVWQPGYVQIPEMAIHPDDPDIAYAAVLGDVFGPNEERGLYRTTDGGSTWEKILYVSDQTGFNDIEIDPSNPRIFYATAWTVYRKPWTIHSGSEEGGVWRSKDSGDTWEKLEGGLPGGLVGKIDVTVSPAMPQRVWALVEAPGAQGGVYRSDDGGDTWRPMNREPKLLSRAWYYTHIYADPQDPDTVYALNTGFYKSTDGGQTFPTAFQVRHGDNHDLWLNPDDPSILINANDGGANISLNGGETFTEQMNQPTAEFYRVAVDNATPYHIYGAQQDNSTAAMSSAGGSDLLGMGGSNFFMVGGGESGHIAVDPRDHNIIYAGNYGGTITRMDRSTGITRSVRAYEDAPTGQQAADLKYRFQWNAPIRISPHDPDVLYHTSQHVHRSRDGGLTWEVISPDLTTDDPTKQGYSGGEGITRDSTGVEVYTTIFAFEESPLTPGLLWAGSDDGLVHISRDSGDTWENITPEILPTGGTVNMIDLSVHDPGRAFIAIYKYREQDYRPYIFRTDDYGATWTLLTDGTNGIPDNHFVRVVRENPDRRGMLFAGTEFGMYVSFDDGTHWQSFQLNLPVVPVTDMVIKDNDLVLSTQGRAFWVLENFSVLSQLTDEIINVPFALLKPSVGVQGGSSPQVAYVIKEISQEPVRMQIVGPDGVTFMDKEGLVAEGGGGEEEIRVPSFVPEEYREMFIEAVKRGDTIMGFDLSAFRGSADSLNVKPGLNTLSFTGRWPAIYDIPEGTIQEGFGGGIGPAALPGTYTVTLTMGEHSATETFEYAPNPHSEATAADYAEQLELAREVGAATKLLYDELAQLRSVKMQATGIGALIAEAGYGDEAATAAGALNEKLTAVEGELTQLQGEGGQDSLNFPGRLDQQFNGLYGAIAFGAAPLGSGIEERWADLEPLLQPLLDQIHEIYETDLVAFNELVGQHGMTVLLKKAEGEGPGQ